MTKNELNKLYFQWMCRLVCKGRSSKRQSYQKLLAHLNRFAFMPTLPMDENRADDGMDLRYRFGYENSYEGLMIATFLDDRPCSMLEMMISLAIHCEESIMDNPDVGDRTGKWFWSMIENLELSDMNDSNYDDRYVDIVLERFNAREYQRDGLGGLFYIPGTRRDMRNAEIWYQMCWYLDEIIEEGGS